MRIFLVLLVAFVSCQVESAPDDQQIVSIDFVEILNGHHEEAHYYYENNWKALRIKALEESYIASFQLLEAPYSAEAPFHLMLMTTYADEAQYANREENFSALIEERGDLKLLNEVQPADFRNLVFYKDARVK